MKGRRKGALKRGGLMAAGAVMALAALGLPGPGAQAAGGAGSPLVGFYDAWDQSDLPLLPRQLRGLDVFAPRWLTIRGPQGQVVLEPDNGAAAIAAREGPRLKLMPLISNAHDDIWDQAAADAVIFDPPARKAFLARLQSLARAKGYGGYIFDLAPASVVRRGGRRGPAFRPGAASVQPAEAVRSVEVGRSCGRLGRCAGARREPGGCRVVVDLGVNRGSGSGGRGRGLGTDLAGGVGAGHACAGQGAEGACRGADHRWGAGGRRVRGHEHWGRPGQGRCGRGVGDDGSGRRRWRRGGGWERTHQPVKIGVQQGKHRQAGPQQKSQQGPADGVEASGVLGDGKAARHRSGPTRG